MLVLVLSGSRWLPRQEVTLNVYDLGTEGGTVRSRATQDA
eukprot:COSAG06_NODE_1109_length_10653_cov_103.721148_2_plen_40_part_00